jgi:hypothetical protein
VQPWLTPVQPWLTPVELRSNTVLHEPGDTIEQVYFPLSGMISLLAVMQSGEAIETGIVGADGLVGGGAAIDGHLLGQLRVQLDGAALTTLKAQFVEAYLRHPHLRNLVLAKQPQMSIGIAHEFHSSLAPGSTGGCCVIATATRHAAARARLDHTLPGAS